MKGGELSVFFICSQSGRNASAIELTVYQYQKDGKSKQHARHGFLRYAVFL